MIHIIRLDHLNVAIVSLLHDLSFCCNGVTEDRSNKVESNIGCVTFTSSKLRLRQAPKYILVTENIRFSSVYIYPDQNNEFIKI